MSRGNDIERHFWHWWRETPENVVPLAIHNGYTDKHRDLHEKNQCVTHPLAAGADNHRIRIFTLTANPPKYDANTIRSLFVGILDGYDQNTPQKDELEPLLFQDDESVGCVSVQLFCTKCAGIRQTLESLMQ